MSKKRIKYQMSSEMNWSNIEIDRDKPISSFDVSNDEELLGAFKRINTQVSMKKIHQHLKTIFSFLKYRLQFNKDYQLISVNGERLNKDF